MQQKKYIDIERLKPKFAEAFEKGDYIVVQEKIDGANFSIRYDSETNTIAAFSRKRQLGLENNLRGALEWSQKLDVDLVKSVLGNNLVLFAEWLVKHTVVYPQDKYQQAYCYDIYDVENEKYLTQDIVEQKVRELGLIYVPVFYRGEFTSWDDLKQFVGKTEMGGEQGEGIVVKNQTKLNHPKLTFYTKLVSESFCETKAHKDSKVVDMNIDDGAIPENWDEHNMDVIAKHMGKEVYYDCKKEEPDVVEQVGEHFGKYSNATAMRIVKKILVNI